MIFYGTGHVWDKEKNGMLCSFANGQVDTEDERTITILQTIGYKSEYGNEIIVESTEIDEEPSEEEIRAKAKELKIRSWHNKKIDRLISEIEELEQR